MIDVAAEFAADVPDLAPARQRAAATRIAALRAGRHSHLPARFDPRNPDQFAPPA